MATRVRYRYVTGMRLLPAFIAFALLPISAGAQAVDTLRTTGGLSLGLSGWKSGDGTTVVGDLMWVGDDINDGPGFRVMRQALSPRSHGYIAMIFIGGPPRDSVNWMRLDFGVGYVGQQSDRSLRFYQRHGIGAQFGATIAPWKLGIVRPELNGWGVLATSARFIGLSLGARILDPRQLR